MLSLAHLASFLVGTGQVVAAKNFTVSVREGPSLTHARCGHATGIVDGRIVVAGGTDWNEQKTVKSWLSDSEVFQNGKWVAGPSLPLPLAYGMSIYDKTGMYIAGGTSEAAPIDGLRFAAADNPDKFRKVYHLAKLGSTWRELTPLPVPVSGGASALLDGKFYIVCGFTGSGLTNQLWSLDTTKTGAAWQPGPPLPGPARAFPGLVACGRYLYLLGGVQGWNPFVTMQDSYRYEPGKQTWCRIADLPWPSYSWTGHSIDNRRILLTGRADETPTEVYGGIWLLDLQLPSFEKIGELVVPATSSPLIPVTRTEWWLIGGEPNFKKTRTNRVTIIRVR